jgi:hypothetical protein
MFAMLAIACALVVAVPSASAGTGPGTWSQVDINNAIANGISYFDANQNADGSWGTSYPGAETALALASYGVLDSNDFSTLSPAQQTRVQNGLAYLLGTQNSAGAFAADGGGFYTTYDTGLALVALSLSSNVPTTTPGAVATAITNARNFLISQQQAPPQESCQSTGTSGSGLGGQSFCGGWNYCTNCFNRSDESNTGFAITGLAVTGGVPPTVAAVNEGWQRNVQQLTANPGGFPARNDGGGAYEPGINSGDFSSNANDSGSLLFGYGFDKVPSTDPSVQAAVTFGNDVIDTYELNTSNRQMVYHFGQNEDGACVIGQPNCDWGFGGDGGYHYSLFALVKGLSEYIPPNLSDPNNFYAKAVDLLLSSQNSDGSWTQDGRDDASTLGATGFAILALGKVATPEQPITASSVSVKATEGSTYNGPVATFSDPDSAAKASDYTATINWGDGLTTSGTISGTPSQFTVSGSHAYAEEGSPSITVTINDPDTASNSATVNEKAAVADAALHAVADSPSVSGKTASGKVASFGDNDPKGTRSDYTASINWGDGTTTAGTITGGPSPFNVSGSHTYSKSGTYTVTTTIRDAGGSKTTAKVTVTIPAQHVKAARVSAKLSGAPACVSGAFVSRVSGNRIAAVKFTLDGRQQRTRTVQRGRQYSARIAVSTGRHNLTVKVRFRSGSSSRSRTFHRTVRGCPPPTFTG